MTYNELAEQMVRMQLNACDSSGNGIPDAGEIGEARVLLHLMNRNGVSTPGNMAGELRLSNGRISNTLNALEKKGMIVRKKHLEDKRRILVSLSGKGKDYIEDKYDRMIRTNEIFLERLGHDDSEELIRLMKKCFGIMQEYDFNDFPEVSPVNRDRRTRVPGV